MGKSVLPGMCVTGVTEVSKVSNATLLCAQFSLHFQQESEIQEITTVSFLQPRPFCGDVSVPVQPTRRFADRPRQRRVHRERIGDLIDRQGR